MNTRALSLVLAAMTLAGCANYSGLDTQASASTPIPCTPASP